MPTRGEIDRLGDALRADPTPEVIGRYLDYRESLSNDLEYVETITREIAPGRAVFGRRKTTDSVVAKLRRTPGMRLSRMQDVAGCRLIVSGINEQDVAVRDLLNQFPKSSADDLRLAPHSGYRAVHVIVRTDAGHFVEIQVRTELQQQWAEMSEKVSDLLGLEVKYGGGPPAVRRDLDFVSLEAWRLDQIIAAPSGAIVERTGAFTIMENASHEQIAGLDAARVVFVAELESALDDLSAAILNAVEGSAQQ